MKSLSKVTDVKFNVFSVIDNNSHIQNNKKKKYFCHPIIELFSDKKLN